MKNHGLWDLLHLNWSKTSNVIREEAEAMFMRARDTGALLTMTSRKRRKIPEQQEGKRIVSGAGSKLSGKACGEPHGDLDEWSSLSICLLLPSPSWQIRVLGGCQACVHTDITLSGFQI